MPPDKDKGSDLPTEVFEKLIDSQIENTRSLTSLTETVKSVACRLQDIERFFTNGFRSDIKQLLSEVDTLKDQTKKTSEMLDHMEDTYDERFRKRQTQYQSITDKIESYKKIGFWFKVVAGFIGAIALIVGSILAVAKILG